MEGKNDALEEFVEEELEVRDDTGFETDYEENEGLEDFEIEDDIEEEVEIEEEELSEEETDEEESDFSDVGRESSPIQGDLATSLGMVESEALATYAIEKEHYTLNYVEAVPIKKITISEPVKKGRKMTVRGLTQSVSELGVLTPIHVMKLETADLDDDDDDDMPEYQLLKGTRRLYASVRNNLHTIPCIVWDFKNKDKGRQAALVLGLTLNRTQKRSWSEVWDLYGILEMQSQIKPSTFESLFQLEGGDAMKLKDVMFSEYPEIKDELLANEKTLDQCYKQLQKNRKEEDKLDMEDKLGLADSHEDGKEIVGNNNNDNVELSNDEVLDLLEMGDSFGNEVSHDDFSEMEGMFNTDQPEYQTSKNRKPLDPALKKKILDRDEYSCKCCGLHGPAFVGAMVVHHVIPVHCFGDKPTSDPDQEDNLVTLCDACHLVLHCIERDGRLPITQEQFEEYEYADQLRIKNILHYARIAIVAGKRKGLTDEQRKKLARTRHRMPGEGYKENLEGYALYEKELKELEAVKEA